jgi:hypothetical protein
MFFFQFLPGHGHGGEKGTKPDFIFYFFFLFFSPFLPGHGHGRTQQHQTRFFQGCSLARTAWIFCFQLIFPTRMFSGTHSMDFCFSTHVIFNDGFPQGQGDSLDKETLSTRRLSRQGDSFARSRQGDSLARTAWSCLYCSAKSVVLYIYHLIKAL